MKKLYGYEYHGYGVQSILSPEEAEAIRKEGIQIDEIVNVIPFWLPWWLVKPWAWLQDARLLWW